MDDAIADPIPMSSADLNESDLQAIIDVMRSGRLALGERTIEFEQAIADYVGVRHAIAVNSGTSALHLIVKALGIGAGDEILVPSFSFAASVNAFLYEGARPIFLDIEPETYNLDPRELERKLTSKTKAIMVVDVFGHPAEWDEILSFAEKHELKVIDDSCEALGAEYRGRRIGSFGHAAAFAFYPNKQITTGEGGMIVTDDAKIAGICRSLRNQGRGEMGSWLEHERLGYNYRLDELSAALGCSQLARLEKFLSKRDHVANLYSERLRSFNWLRTPSFKAHVRMSWFVYVITLAEGMDRDPIMKEMESRGVPVRGYFSPIHLQPYIKEYVTSANNGLEVTESIAKRTIALPFHNQLSISQIERAISTLAEAARSFI
jgi:perosamine synthetase